MKKLTAKRPIALLLCVVMVLSLIPVLPMAASAENQYKVYDNGTAVTSVAVPQSKGEVTLTAKGEGVSSYQWQIKAGDTWVNIRGEKSATLKLRYAMVASLMEGGAAQIRCYTSENVATDPVTVTLSTEAPVFKPVDSPVKIPTTNKAVAAMNAPTEQESAPSADNGKAEYDRLNGIYNEAKAAYLNAENAYNDAVFARNDAQQAVDTCAAKVAAAEAALNAAKAPAETAPTAEGETAETSAPTQAPTVDTTELEKAVADAKTQLASAQELLAEKEQAVTAAEAVKNDAQAKRDAAEADKNAYINAQNEKGKENNKVNGLLGGILSGTNALDEPGADVPATHSVVINYVFTDGTQAASPYTASVAHGSDLDVNVTSPTVQGYTPSEEKVIIKETVNADITRTVTYNPALVNYTVKHYKQNLNDDNYGQPEIETKQGYTESEVGKNQAKTYEGFYALLYDDTVQIAADGSTVVEIYYDRYYYLMSFDLDGGYGVEPIYARYGAPIEWKTPVKQGYTFAGWTPSASGVDTMPAENRTYKANWTLHDKVNVTVIFWGENPNDEGYSYDHSGTVTAEPGKDFTFSENYQFIICGQEAHTHGPDCEYGCGKTEHTHSGAECGYACGETEHKHSASCYTLTCTQPTDHTHSTSCYANVGDATSHIAAPNNPKNGQIYKWNAVLASGVSIYINGTWYKWTGNRNSVSNGQIMPATCGKTEHKHTGYTGSCYTLTCGQKEHTHSASCGYGCGKEAHKHSNACGMSCGKTEHQHSAACYQNGAGMDPKLWKFVRSETVTVAPDGSSIINVYYDRTEFTMTFHYDYRNNRYQKTEAITAKWGAYIGDKFTQMNTTAGTSMWSRNSNATKPYTAYWDIMPTENRDYYAYTPSGSDHTAYYYKENLNGEDEFAFSVTAHGNSVTVTVNEDFPDLQGFTKNIDKSAKDGNKFNNAKFYYDRNSYKLEYMSSGTKLEDMTANVKYEAPLTPYNITPSYPDNLEPGAYVFGGWYDDQYFQQPVKWDSTMPASDKVVYAKWVPVTHTVTFALDKNTQPGLYEAQTVPHGSKIAPVENPTNGQYTFIGWFYTDENGVEKAFDPANMPVNRDLNLYGKWSANSMVEYTIRYALDANNDGIADTDENGDIIYIAAPVTSKALALTTKTFEAKTGTDLNAGYQSGYFPREASHSILMSADEGAKNEWTFLYVPKEKVPYTVKYLNAETGAELVPEKTIKTPDAIVTENYVPVTGYMPDKFQQRLILSAEGENVIIFWYTKDNEHAPVRVVDHFQNISGDGYAEGVTRSEMPGTINETQTADPLTNQPGFQYDHATHQTFKDGSAVNNVADTSGHVEVTLTADGLQIDFYYNRIEYPYEFKFLEQGTDIVLADSTTGTARYQAQVSENAKDIAGYDCVTPSPQAMTIAIEDPAGTAKNNVRIFYYQEKKVTIEYKVVGPDGQIDTTGNIGTASPTSETIKVRTDVASGSTAAPKDGTYKFVGWYKDAACTQPVDDTWVTNTTHITPAKTGDKDTNGVAQTYEAATYYAKFEYNLTSMTISKTGNAYDAENDTFIFDVYHKGTKVTTVTMQMNGSVTISGLTVGEEYTVKERTTGTRYNAHADQRRTLDADKTKNTVTFSNSVRTDKWLTSSMTKKNEFNG